METSVSIVLDKSIKSTINTGKGPSSGLNFLIYYLWLGSEFSDPICDIKANSEFVYPWDQMLDRRTVETTLNAGLYIEVENLIQQESKHFHCY